MHPRYKIPESTLVVIYTPALEVLLIERAGHSGFWQSVTGSKDTLDEPLAATALREVAEETGITLASFTPPARLEDWALTNVYDIYPAWRHRYAPHVRRNTEHVFGLMVPAVCAVVLCAREHTASCWLPYQQAADLCFSPSNAEAVLLLPRFSKLAGRA